MGACYSKTATHKEDFDDDADRWSDKLKHGSMINNRGSNVEEYLLRHVPGRLFGNGSCNIASLHTQQGKKGINQDAMIVWEKFNSKGDAVFCGVFDGHGPYGHVVARKVRDTLPVQLSTQWIDIDWDCENDDDDDDAGKNKGRSYEDKLLDEYWCELSDVEEKETVPERFLPLRRSMLESFKLIDKELRNNPWIDCFCSGTTAVSLIKQGHDLVIGNVGDSRAVLATRDEKGSLVAVQLTIDLKPNLPREAARIQQYKGRVFALQDEPEVARIWLPHNDSPGLAMARAFGDFCLKDFGLISVPDIFYHRITENDQFVILATDGVWDVLSNKEALDIVATAPSRMVAAHVLVDHATRAWKLKYPTSRNDDCTAVCLFLDHKPIPISHATLQNVTKSYTLHDNDQIKDELPDNSITWSKKSLADCISTSEDEEWSALEGVTRVNSLLNIPRFFSVGKTSVSPR
ncbi:hypothetical protein QVD17_27104 [Tagetes erecta]|uniref:PPM-type phosphatase domain-containing protein n=1 Tax=Tagetes erecta TaxID=13708 RepID=A0AAD8KAA3_TARER|nr:hypothetical protein QVD17_27104 [Tagetes erecta]